MSKISQPEFLTRLEIRFSSNSSIWCVCDLQASHGHQSGFLEGTTPVYALEEKHLKKILECAQKLDILVILYDMGVKT